MRLLERLPVGRLHARMPWWLRLALGVAAIVLGALIVIRPTTALGVLAWPIGVVVVLLSPGLTVAVVADLFAWTHDRFSGIRVDRECTRTDVSWVP